MDINIERVQKQIGKNIKKLRLERNYTQLDLAKKLGITDVAISQLERGKSSFNLNRIIQLCKVFEITVYHIFKDTAIGVNIDITRNDFKKVHEQLDMLKTVDFQLIQIILNFFERKYNETNEKAIANNKKIISVQNEGNRKRTSRK